jgi:hypothetical protein
VFEAVEELGELESSAVEDTQEFLTAGCTDASHSVGAAEEKGKFQVVRGVCGEQRVFEAVVFGGRIWSRGSVLRGGVQSIHLLRLRGETENLLDDPLTCQRGTEEIASRAWRSCCCGDRRLGLRIVWKKLVRGRDVLRDGADLLLRDGELTVRVPEKVASELAEEARQMLAVASVPVLLQTRFAGSCSRSRGLVSLRYHVAVSVGGAGKLRGESAGEKRKQI